MPPILVLKATNDINDTGKIEEVFPIDSSGTCLDKGKVPSCLNQPFL